MNEMENLNQKKMILLSFYHFIYLFKIPMTEVKFYCFLSYLICKIWVCAYFSLCKKYNK